MLTLRKTMNPNFQVIHTRTGGLYFQLSCWRANLQGGLGGNETIFNSQWGLLVFLQIHAASRKRGLVCELTRWFRWK
jgi:hypothetical protein